MKNPGKNLASVVAQRIAQDGITWTEARKELLDELPGVKPSELPNDDQIESALREYYAIYDSSGHAKRLLELRRIALLAMRELEIFSPVLVKGVLNGCADKYSDIYLEITGATAKDAEIFLLNKEIDFEIVSPSAPGEAEFEETIRYEAPALAEGYFRESGTPVWVSLKVASGFPQGKRKRRKNPDAWQIEEETEKTASIEKLEILIEKTSG